MKLKTFQSLEALKYLINHGYLICDETYINQEKYGYAYNFITTNMAKKINREANIKYPIWCWVKCYNGICPNKHKGQRVEGFDVKITFEKDEHEVFITDYRRYSFVLNNLYLPESLNDKKQFEREQKKAQATNDKLLGQKLISKIKKSHLRCIITDSNILQGTIWKLNLSDVIKIELLPHDGYVYGSLNYPLKNGNRISWPQQFYKIIATKKD